MGSTARRRDDLWIMSRLQSEDVTGNNDPDLEVTNLRSLSTPADSLGTTTLPILREWCIQARKLVGFPYGKGEVDPQSL